jgi:hypothetical protein
MPNGKKSQGEEIGIFTLINIQIAIQKMKISFTFKTFDMSDLLALIAYVQFSKTEILNGNPFSRICLFCIFVRNRISVMKIEVLGPAFWQDITKISP